MTLFSTLLLLSGPAQAEEPPAFVLDTILVSIFEVEDIALKPEADRLRAMLLDGLRDRFSVVDLDSIPSGQDYSAQVYLDSCPTGALSECTYVIASRGQVDWAIFGHLTAQEVVDTSDASLLDLDEDALRAAAIDASFESKMIYGVTIGFVDVKEHQKVLDFEGTLSGDNDQAFVDGIAGILDQVMLGGASAVDVRGIVDDPKSSWQLRKAESLLAAQDLIELEDDLDSIGDSERDHWDGSESVTMADLDALDGSELGTPWEDLSLSKDEYFAMKNSGKRQEEWLDQRKGRMGRVGFSLAAGTGFGPYHQAFDGRYLRDNVDVTNVLETVVYQEVVGGMSSLLLEGGLSLGLSETFAVGLVCALKTADFNYTIYQEVLGSPLLSPPAPEKRTAQTWELALRAEWVPMPLRDLRPRVLLGVAYWTGTNIDSLVSRDSLAALEPLPLPNTMLLAEVGSGVERSLGSTGQLFAQLVGKLPVAGNTLNQVGSPDQLSNIGTPAGRAPIGIEFMVGLDMKLTRWR